MTQENPYYSCMVPRDMVDGPHMVHFAGVLMQPGRHNDYTIEFHDDTDAIIHWWDSVVNEYGEKLISITQLRTGKRWAHSSRSGVYVDTRR
jgi:hypothetical protein